MSLHSAPDPSSFPVYFDAQASQSAQPVVLFETVSSSAKPIAPRRSWLILAVAVSALIGGLTGVAAYSIYQRGATANKTAPTQQQAAPANSVTTAATTNTSSPVSLTTQRAPTAAPIDTGERQIDAAPIEARDVNAAAAQVTTNEAATERTRNADSNANATIATRREVGNNNADAEAARRTSTRTNAASPTTSASVPKDERAKRENEQSDESRHVDQTLRHERRRTKPERADEDRRARRVARPSEDQQTPREAQPGYTERVRDVFENGGRDDAPPRPRPNRRKAERLRQIFEGRDQQP